MRDRGAELVSKGEFAVQRGVSAGRVSQWISEGKIGPEALVGTGQRAKINVPLAVEHLRARLDAGQRFGNGLATNLRLPPQADPAAATAAPRPPAPVVDLIDERIKRAKLEEVEFRNRRAAEEEQERNGRYMRTSEARAGMVRVAGDMLKLFEGALPEIASAIATRFHAPQRDLLHCLRQEVRGVRSKAAENLKRQAQDLPEFLADDIES